MRDSRVDSPRFWSDSSQFRVRVGGRGSGGRSGRTLYATLLHIAALRGYESTVFAKRSPRAEFSPSIVVVHAAVALLQGHLRVCRMATLVTDHRPLRTD